LKATTEPLRLVSATFPPRTYERILGDARPFTDVGHYRYPDDADGSHTKGFFAIEPVTRSDAFVDAIADDVEGWFDRTAIDADLVFAPAQPAVRPLAEAVAARLGRPTAYWEFHPTGRYGDRLVAGAIPRGSRVLALNGVSLQGRCVGLRLPQFAAQSGADVVAAAVFAKGTADLVRKTEQLMGDRFYSTLRVDVPLYRASECPMCAATHEPPVSWRTFAEAPR
jgi:hypothetical protein